MHDTATSSQTATEASAAPSRGLRLMAALVRWVWWLIMAIAVLFGATWGLLHGLIVPRIEDFRPRLESLASKSLGIPVRVGQISGESRGLIPTFELKDVTLQDSAGRQVLLLPRVLVALSVTSMWSGGFEQLVIDQPVLDVRRTADGKIYVGGLDVDQKGSGGHAAADWFFSQPEFAIQGGAVRWTDELAKAPVLELQRVDAVLRSSARGHSFRLDATPPASWGERFSLRGIFRQPLLAKSAGDFSDWSGQLYADFKHVGNVAQIKPYLTDTFGVNPKAGSGSLRAWVDVSKGRIGGATLDVALQGVDVQLGKSLSPLALRSATGRVGGKLLDDGFEFATEGLTFNTEDGLAWPGGNLAMTSRSTAGKTEQKNELKADRLDLAAVAQIASRLPLGTRTHALIASFEPKGLVQTLQASWVLPASGNLNAISYSAKGLVSGLEVAALPSQLLRSTPATSGGGEPTAAPRQQPGRPGVKSATVDFDLTQAGGKAAVTIAQGHLDLPGVFEDPRVTFDKLSLDAEWKLTGEKIEAHLRNVKFAAADADGQAEAHWRSGDSQPPSAETSLGVLDVKGVISRGNGARVHRYLPLVLADPVRHYVRDAVEKGDVTDVKFVVKGPVDLIPFADPTKGDFKISAKVKNGAFAYVPKLIQPPGAAPWPALTDINGELVFNRASLEVNNAQAKVAGLPTLQLVKVDARIPNLMRGATVDVQARIKGPASEALAFVSSSPLATMTGNVLTSAVASGAADYALHLSLPINNIDKTTVQGTVTLPGNDAQFSSTTPKLERLKGVVTFSESGFNVQAAQARVLGGDVRFEGGMRPPTGVAGAATDAAANTVFRAQGTLTAEALRQSKDIGIGARLAQNASGSAAYNAVIGFRRGTAEVQLTSNLQGMALSLPAPLNKSAEALLPVRFETALVRESTVAGQPLQDQLSLSVAGLATVQYVRDISGPEARVIRGSMAVGLEPGESSVLPDSGVAANIKLATFNVDAWEKVFSNAVGASTTSVAALVATSAASQLAQSYLPNQIALRAKELTVSGRKLNNLVIGGTREGSLWRANLDATELNGYLEFRQPGATGAGRVFARLSRLGLGPGNASDVESLLDEQPANIPALDIVVDELELRGKKLGRVEIDAINLGGQSVAGVREWRLRKFDVTLPEAVLKANGNWVAVNAQGQGVPRVQRSNERMTERRRTVMNFDLTLLDSGELLNRLGQKDVVRRGKGKMAGQVAWLGSPLTLDYPSMNGQFNVNIESGQFLKADPGLAKLLGVLSLQSLPRRLVLDFRDVFSEGFAFDFVRGDVTINQGVASTNNLQMKGVNAAVLMEGSADIAKETQDLKVVVVPEINAGTASLITAVINPVIGIGTFLAQFFLRQPLIKAATQEFHIDGSWADPKVTKVQAGKPVTDSKTN